MVPVVELPPCTPLTSHVTPVFVVPLTEAVNCCVTPVCNVALAGEIVTIGEVVDESLTVALIAPAA